MKAIKARNMVRGQIYVVPSEVTGDPVKAVFSHISQSTTWAVVHPVGQGGTEGMWAVDVDAEVFEDD